MTVKHTKLYCISHRWCHHCISQNICCNDNNTYHLEKYFPIILCEFSCNGKTSITSGLLTCDPLLSFIVQYAAWNDEGTNLLLHIEQILHVCGSLLYNGYRVFPGGKEWPGHDTDPSPSSSAVVKKG